MNATSAADRPSRTVRVTIPIDTHARLRHLAVDRGVHLADLMLEAVTLLLRYYECGADVSDPVEKTEAGR